MCIIGIDVGGTKIAYGLFDGEGRIIDRLKVPSDVKAEASEFFDQIIKHVYLLLKRNGRTIEELCGIGIGLPSFIMYEQGYILKTSTLVNLKSFPAREYLEKGFGGKVRVLLDNDAHVAALAEQRKGAGRGFKNMFYCAVSTGISSAMIIDGKLYRGEHGFAGESGHQIITPGEGVLCGCGNRGCLMSYISGGMIVRHVQNWIEAGNASCIVNHVADLSQIQVEDIAWAYDLGDEVAHRALAQMAKYMAVWLFNLYVTMDIDCFVFGGGLLNLEDRLFPEVRKQFDSYRDDNMPVYFKRAELEDDFGIIGAAQLFE